MFPNWHDQQMTLTQAQMLAHSGCGMPQNPSPILLRNVLRVGKAGLCGDLFSRAPPSTSGDLAAFAVVGDPAACVGCWRRSCFEWFRRCSIRPRACRGSDARLAVDLPPAVDLVDVAQGFHTTGTLGGVVVGSVASGSEGALVIPAASRDLLPENLASSRSFATAQDDSVGSLPKGHSLALDSSLLRRFRLGLAITRPVDAIAYAFHVAGDLLGFAPPSPEAVVLVARADRRGGRPVR